MIPGVSLGELVYLEYMDRVHLGRGEYMGRYIWVEEKKLQKRVRVNGQRGKGENSGSIKSWGKRRDCF